MVILRVRFNKFGIMNRELSEVTHKKELPELQELTLDNSIGRNCGRLPTMGK